MPTNPLHPDVTFVVNRNNLGIFERNFASSPCLEAIGSDRIIVQEGFPSATLSYNEALEKAPTDLVVFVHQDVFLPEGWLTALGESLKALEQSDPNWGVLGGWGVTNAGTQAGFLYSVGLGILGKPFTSPVAIDTLDEYFLVLRKSSGLRFDSTLPHFHLYGTDICMAARRQLKMCYAIPAFAVHNTSYTPLPPEFFQGYWHIRKRWAAFMPIQTPCIRISRLNQDLIARRLKQAFSWVTGKKFKSTPRIDDPRSVLHFAFSPERESVA